jgi:Flp pilus assembly protein TadD
VLLQQAVALDDRDAFAHNNLGVLYELKGQHPRAKEEFRRALSIDPGLDEAIGNLKRLEG